MRSKVAQLNFQFLSGNYPEYRVTFNLRLILSLSHGNNDPGRSSGFQPASLTLSLRKQSAPGRNLSSDYRRYVCHAIRSYLEGIHCEITVGISQTDFVTRIHPNPSSSSLGVPRFYFLFSFFSFSRFSRSSRVFWILDRDLRISEGKLDRAHISRLFHGKSRRQNRYKTIWISSGDRYVIRLASRTTKQFDIKLATSPFE